MSNSPRYTGQSVALRRLFNGASESEPPYKIATNSEVVRHEKSHVEQGVEAHFDAARLVSPQHTPTTPKTHHTNANQTPNRQWRKLTETEKLMAAHMVASEHGALAFTINFSERLQNTLQGSADLCRLISGYIGRELRKALGHTLPHLFTLEVSLSGKLHAHGVVVIGHDLSEERIIAIDKALGRAGGVMKAARIVRQTQSYLDHLYDASGWAMYLTKARNVTRRHLSTEKISFISTDLIRMTKG